MEKFSINHATKINDETVSFFSIFIKDINTIRIQGQTVNENLNRIRWDMFGIQAQLGSLKDHINNHAACFLFNSLFGFDMSANDDSKEIVTKAVSEAKTHSEQFSSIEKIQKQLDQARPGLGARLDEQQLCIFVLRNEFEKAQQIIEENRKLMPVFELTFFAHAELYLRKRHNL